MPVQCGPSHTDRPFPGGALGTILHPPSYAHMVDTGCTYKLPHCIRPTLCRPHYAGGLYTYPLLGYRYVLCYVLGYMVHSVVRTCVDMYMRS